MFGRDIFAALHLLFHIMSFLVLNYFCYYGLVILSKIIYFIFFFRMQFSKFCYLLYKLFNN